MTNEQVRRLWEHAPVHLINLRPRAGVAVSLIVVPEVNAALQRVPQLMRLPGVATVPLPLRSTLTVKELGDSGAPT